MVSRALQPQARCRQSHIYADVILSYLPVHNSHYITKSPRKCPRFQCSWGPDSNSTAARGVGGAPQMTSSPPTATVTLSFSPYMQAILTGLQFFDPVAALHSSADLLHILQAHKPWTSYLQEDLVTCSTHGVLGAVLLSAHGAWQGFWMSGGTSTVWSARCRLCSSFKASWKHSQALHSTPFLSHLITYAWLEAADNFFDHCCCLFWPGLQLQADVWAPLFNTLGERLAANRGGLT